MTKKLLGLLLSAILIPAALFAQSGKIAGKVSDSKTGEALALANVIIEGTTFGAATNENGEYVILNVAPGTYTVKARYLGYSDQAISNITVNGGLTRTVNFKLSSTDKELETVEVVADRPLINPNATNSTSIVTADQISNLPVRGINNIVALQSGAVSIGGNIFVRGSRGDQTNFLVDGVSTSDPLFGGSTNGGLVTNAVEELQFQSGGMDAEYGGANGGVVSTSMKTGGSNYKFSGEYISDGFSADKGTFGGVSTGYNEAVGSISGPLPLMENFTFFALGRFLSQESPAQFWDGLDIKNVPTTLANGDPTTIDLSYPANKRLEADFKSYTFNGNINANFNPFTIRYTNTTNYSTGKNGPLGLGAILNQGRTADFENLTQTHAIKFTHSIDPTMYYTVTGSFFNDYFTSYDPYFKDDISKYGDPNQPQNTGVDVVSGRSKLQSAYNVFGTFSFTKPGTPTAGYEKRSQSVFAVAGDFTKQLGRVHELKAGFEFKSYSIRRLVNGNSFQMYNFTKVDGITNSDQLASLTRSDIYGYDMFGKEVNGTGIADGGPKTPNNLGIYFKEKAEYQDLVINASIRYDRYDTKGYVLREDSVNFTSDPNKGQVISLSDISETKPLSYISPRLGFSFPVTDKTKFHSQFGKYVSQSRLRDTFVGYQRISDYVNGGNAFQTPVGVNLKPEKTTSYEVGFEQQVTENASFDITAFYKDIQDQVQLRQAASVPAYYRWVNGDFSTSSGIAMKMTVRRTNRVSSNISYTYSNSRGTGSNPSTSFRTIWQAVGTLPYYPQYQQSLDFDQRHRGSIEVDYRFASNDGPDIAGIRILENFGINLLSTFNSGTPFTKVDGYGNGRVPTEAINASYTPWNYQLDMKMDKSIKISDFNLNLYVWVVNLLNTKNTTNVFIQTGTASNDGYLTTDEGKTATINNGAKYEEVYNAMTNSNNPGFYSAPRQVRFGVKLDF